MLYCAVTCQHGWSRHDESKRCSEEQEEIESATRKITAEGKERSLLLPAHGRMGFGRNFPFEEAFRKTADLDAVYEAPNQEAAIAQIKAVKGFSKIAENLPLSGIWAKYEVHPDRARPLTPHEPLMHRFPLQEFIDYAEGRISNENGPFSDPASNIRQKFPPGS